MKSLNFFRTIKFLAFGFWLLALSSCYSFTGSSLSPETKTILIKNFYDSTLVNPNLSQDYSSSAKYVLPVTLAELPENPDILIEGQIMIIALRQRPFSPGDYTSSTK